MDTSQVCCYWAVMGTPVDIVLIDHRIYTRAQWMPQWPLLFLLITLKRLILPLKFYYIKHGFFFHLVYLQAPTFSHLPIPKIVQKFKKKTLDICNAPNIQQFLSYVATCEFVLILPTVKGQNIGASSSYHMIQQSYSWPYIWTKLQFKKIYTPVCSYQHCLQ